MKWYTCTPVPFKGDHTFFSRDSGAFCKAFQRIGLESRAIMPTPVQEGDDPDLIRTEYANLEDAAQLVAQYDIVEAAVAEKAIPYCNIVCITGEEMKSSVQGYFQVLFDQNPQSVGGALPGDDFYYLGQ